MMTWSTMSSVQKTLSALFVENGDSFTVNDDCLSLLEDILRDLSADDCTSWPFKRALGAGENVSKVLLPLLVRVRDDADVLDAARIVEAAVRILVNLTVPLEYHMGSIEASSHTEVGKRTICELSKVLSASKEAFADSRSTKAVVDHMKSIIERKSPMSAEDCDSVNDCLLLLRNVLHIPEGRAQGSGSAVGLQNQILWNLFTQSVDKIIIYLLSCPRKTCWSITVVQLIALMYKDQHEGTLQKLLNLWLEGYYSDSSEDNESNTSPPEQGSNDSSPVVTSDPTSDSSDNGGNCRNTHNTGNNNNNNNNNMVNVSPDWNKIINTTEVIRAVQNKCKSAIAITRNESTETETTSSSGIFSMSPSAESNGSQSQSSVPQSRKSSVGLSIRSEISDCGYVTQLENQESISTSSNEDDLPCEKPVHQKPHTFQKTRYSNKNRAATTLEKKELRRKKLVKRRKSNNINMKGLLHHSPTEDDISNILKEFTVDFLLKGYGNLVNDLHSHLLSNVHVQMDTSHFLWLVTYFLKFAIQLELDPEHISPVLTWDILSYLVFQGVCIYEEFEISCSMEDVDLRPCLRRLHLVVTALREFLQGIEAYQKMIHLSDNDRNHLETLRRQIVQTQDIKMLFILLLRQYNPNIQSRQYLQDLILTNHNFLLFLDKSDVQTEKNPINLMIHMKQFASVEVMRQYGLLLEGFKENGEYVNNCIFTMMHHIGGDLQSVSTLFQPSILKTFSQIWETDYEICDDWADLIEYVIHKFINTPNNHCGKTNSTMKFEKDDTQDKLEDTDHISQSEFNPSEWTREEKDDLLRYYNENKESSDFIALITEKYEEHGIRFKTQISVINELLDQRIISENEYDCLLKHQEIDSTDHFSEVETKEKIFDRNVEAIEYLDSDIKVLKEYLVKENKGKHLIWLQQLLLETCCVKLVQSSPEEFKNNDSVMEPTVYYSARCGFEVLSEAFTKLEEVQKRIDNSLFLDLNLPVPVIPWTTEQTNILKHQPFVLLLHKLGIYMPADTGKIFVRIPNFWTVDYIFSIAQQLAPIDTEKLKFDVNRLKIRNKCDSAEVEYSNTYNDIGKFSTIYLRQLPSIRYTPLKNQLSIAIPDTQLASCNLPLSELAIVSHQEAFDKPRPSSPITYIHESDPILDDLDRNSNCDTASVASDLTRMCVSDEEDNVVLVIKKKTEKKS
ncbi:unnamed protein product [Phaedon cochleariae]|uniref:Timeless n=1 Tax=Phaedon cochleariae TaxID=80249 RepID=A0A9N9X0P3_PHACE|nr:unnamed protein product [Phaedon cochleariae]